MLSDIKNNRNKVIGLRQTLRAIEEEQVIKVLMAEDVDPPIEYKIFKVAQKYNVKIEIIASKAALGELCGLEVPSACAAILK